MNKEISKDDTLVVKPAGKSIIAVTGASGFIGRRLIECLLKRGDIEIRALVRNSVHPFQVGPGLSVITGDLSKIETLSGFLVPGCTVINLAYDFNATSVENLRSTENLLRICRDSHVKRLIHCSTASVFGRVKQNVLNEEVVCNPTSEYGIAKLAIETSLQKGACGNFEFINVRPTSVFGPRGPALKKLIDDLKHGNIFVNYLRSCLFNERKLNLVNVDTLVNAILFLYDQSGNISGHTFIVSEDDELINNFSYVERYLFHEIYGREHLIRPIKIPLKILAFVLWIRGRDNTNPLRIFDAGKIHKMGFIPPRSLAASLRDFARWEVERSNMDSD